LKAQRLSEYQPVKFEWAPLVAQLGLESVPHLHCYNHLFLRLDTFIYKQQKTCQQYLTVDGEQWPRNFPYTTLFIVIRALASQLFATAQGSLISTSLWLARIMQMHGEILGSPTETLKCAVLPLYEQALCTMAGDPLCPMECLVALKCEFSNVLLFYYKY